MIKEIKDQAALLADYLATLNRKITQGQALEAISRLHGSKSWNVLSSKLRKPSAPEAPTPPSGCSQIAVLDVSMIDLVGDYDVPEQVVEWEWVEEHASFRHKGNGEDPGVWEHMVHCERAESRKDSMPELLKPVFAHAKAAGAVWVLFHQG